MWYWLPEELLEIGCTESRWILVAQRARIRLLKQHQLISGKRAARRGDFSGRVGTELTKSDNYWMSPRDKQRPTARYQLAPLRNKHWIILLYSFPETRFVQLSLHQRNVCERFVTACSSNRLWDGLICWWYKYLQKRKVAPWVLLCNTTQNPSVQKSFQENPPTFRNERASFFWCPCKKQSKWGSESSVFAVLSGDLQNLDLWGGGKGLVGHSHTVQCRA